MFFQVMCGVVLQFTKDNKVIVSHFLLWDPKLIMLLFTKVCQINIFTKSKERGRSAVLSVTELCSWPTFIQEHKMLNLIQKDKYCVFCQGGSLLKGWSKGYKYYLHFFSQIQFWKCTWCGNKRSVFIKHKYQTLYWNTLFLYNHWICDELINTI